MLERLNRCWRILATGFCFAVFGLGGLVVRCVVYPVLLLTVRNPLRRQHLSQAVIHHSFRWFVALMRAWVSWRTRYVDWSGCSAVGC